MAAAALSMLARPAIAQGTYPAGVGTIKLVVPYPAGGATDVIGRIVADRLSVLWNASVIVENIAGAAANIGMDRVAKGPTDGSTLFMVPPQIAINQYLYAKLAFDPEKDLVPISQVASLPNILVVKKQLTEIKTVKDLIDYAKANPGKLNYASSGQRLDHSSLRRTVQGHDRHRDEPHPVSRQCAGGERSRRRAGRPDVR